MLQARRGVGQQRTDGIVRFRFRNVLRQNVMATRRLQALANKRTGKLVCKSEENSLAVNPGTANEMKQSLKNEQMNTDVRLIQET